MKSIIIIFRTLFYNNIIIIGCFPIEIDADDSDSDDNILLQLPIPSNMLPSSPT